MSGPKYYTPPVHNISINTSENAYEVYRRMSKMRSGVSIRVNGNKIECTVSQSDWVSGVTRAELERRVRAAEAEIAEDRHLMELLQKDKAGEKNAVKEDMENIRKDAERAIREVRESVSMVEDAADSMVTEISTPFGEISFAADKVKKIGRAHV